MDAVAEKVGTRAKVVKINVDEHGVLAGQYGVSAIPALLIFRDGKVAEEINASSDILDKLLAHAP